MKHCKWEISKCLARNVVNKEDGESCNSAYIYGEIGEFQSRQCEIIPDLHKLNGYLRKRASVQVSAKSLEWIPLSESLNMEEFNHRKAKGGQKEKQS